MKKDNKEILSFDDGFENLNWIPSRYLQLYRGE